MNVAKIKKEFSLEEIIKNYSSHNVEYEKFAPQNLKNNRYAFDYYEPYNPFFVWLTTNFKTLFLDASIHADGISTVLHDHVGEPFLYHSWFSRLYGKDIKHTERIENLFLDATGRKVNSPSITTKVQFSAENLIGKYFIPAKREIERKIMLS